MISHSDVRNLEAYTGKRVDIIPAKIVWAEKPLEAGAQSASRKKKARVVCCGNYQQKKQEEVYTSLMDATGLRLLTKVAAVRGGTLESSTSARLS